MLRKVDLCARIGIADKRARVRMLPRGMEGESGETMPKIKEIQTKYNADRFTSGTSEWSRALYNARVLFAGESRKAGYSSLTTQRTEARGNNEDMQHQASDHADWAYGIT